jgi:acyl transferase domain-containing protein
MAKEPSKVISIIGFSFALSGADSQDTFWQLMAAGICVASNFP